MKKENHKASKQNFKPRKLTGVNKIAAEKAKIANAAVPPNRDTSMKGGTSI